MTWIFLPRRRKTTAACKSVQRRILHHRDVQVVHQWDALKASSEGIDAPPDERLRLQPKSRNMDPREHTIEWVRQKVSAVT